MTTTLIRKCCDDNILPNAKRMTTESIEKQVSEEEQVQHRAALLARYFTRQTLPYCGNGSLRAGSLSKVLLRMKACECETFVDLGCGPGNVLAFAATLYPSITRAIGYEYNGDVVDQKASK